MPNEERGASLKPFTDRVKSSATNDARADARTSISNTPTTPVASAAGRADVETPANVQSRHKFAALVLIAAMLLVLAVLAVGMVAFCVLRRRRRRRGHEYSAASDG